MFQFKKYYLRQTQDANNQVITQGIIIYPQDLAKYNQNQQDLYYQVNKQDFFANFPKKFNQKQYQVNKPLTYYLEFIAHQTFNQFAKNKNFANLWKIVKCPISNYDYYFIPIHETITLKYLPKEHYRFSSNWTKLPKIPKKMKKEITNFYSDIYRKHFLNKNINNYLNLIFKNHIQLASYANFDYSRILGQDHYHVFYYNMKVWKYKPLKTK